GRKIRADEPDRNCNQDWPTNQRHPLRPWAHVGKMQSADQHSDPKQIIDKLYCSHHRPQLALVNDTFDHHECLEATTRARATRPERPRPGLRPARCVAVWQLLRCVVYCDFVSRVCAFGSSSASSVVAGGGGPPSKCK